MSDWFDGQLADSIAALDAGVSVNAEDRPHGAGEIGVLKTSAVSGGQFLPNQNKTVVEHERRLVAEPVQGDSILVSRMNTPALVGESCYVCEAHPSLFLPDRLWQLKPKDSAKICMRWMSFVLQSAAYRRHVEVHATGTSGSMKNLPKSKLLALPVSYPAPTEQVQIAEILDTLDTAIHETEAIIAKLKAVKQGLLHDLLTRGIAANGELRPPQAEAPHLYQQSPLGWIPKEWNSQELHEMVATDSPITYGVVQPGPEIEGGVPFIRGGDIYGGRILVEQLRTISQRISNGYRRTKLRGGELLMSLVGYPGEVGIVPIGLAGANIARQAALIRLADPALASYVMHYLSSKGGKRQILGQSLGSAQQVVNLGDLRTVQIPLPLPDESAEVACRIGAANQRIDQEIGELNKLRKLKAALMDDLLTGRVRVTPLLEAAAP